MTDLTLHLQFKKLYRISARWREKLEFREENNREWEEFLDVGNSFFLSEFDRDLIYHIFPVDKDMMMMNFHFKDLPSRPIYESKLESELSIKTQACFFDIFLIKKTYATWLQKCIMSFVNDIMKNNNGEQAYVDLSDALYRLQDCIIGMVYFAVYNDFDEHDTLLDTNIIASEAKRCQVNAELALMDIAFISNELGHSLPELFFAILSKTFEDLAYELDVI